MRQERRRSQVGLLNISRLEEAGPRSNPAEYVTRALSLVRLESDDPTTRKMALRGAVVPWHTVDR